MTPSLLGSLTEFYSVRYLPFHPRGGVSSTEDGTTTEEQDLKTELKGRESGPTDTRGPEHKIPSNPLLLLCLFFEYLCGCPFRVCN